MSNGCVGHFHWLLKFEIGYMLRTSLLWREPEMLFEGASEGFMRTITGIERYGQNIWSTVDQGFSGLAQPSATDVECEPVTCTGAKCPRQVVSGNPHILANRFKREVASEMAFDVPECL